MLSCWQFCVFLCSHAPKSILNSIYVELNDWTFVILCVCVCVQVQTDISVDTKHQTLQGVAFPLHRDAVAALERFKDKKLNYVQLVSPYKQTITLLCKWFDKQINSLSHILHRDMRAFGQELFTNWHNEILIWQVPLCHFFSLKFKELTSQG